jgi:hypothetical protein
LKFPKDHPWYGEEFGATEYYWYVERQYCISIFFELDNRPFVKFCKEKKVSSNQLVMKIAAGLSEKYLPQYVVALNNKVYPSRYPAGYVRKIRPEKDMLEWVSVRERDSYFREKLVRSEMTSLEKWLVHNMPWFTVWLAKHVFPRREVKNQYTLMVTRNPMKEVGFPISFSGTNYRSFIIAIPFGDKVTATFGAPHCFANVDYYKDFIGDLKKMIEHPETIPQELLEKRYQTVAQSYGREKSSD